MATTRNAEPLLQPTGGGNEMNSVRQMLNDGIVGAVESLASAATVDEVVGILRKHARRLVGADGIAVILREDDKCHYVEEDAVGPLWKGQSFPLASCVSGWAMLNRQSVVIGDISQDDRVPYALYRNTFVRSMAMVPVRADNPIGAIGAYWSEPYEAPPETVGVLERLARAAATAIDNARLVAALSRALSDAELARDELRHRVKNAYVATQGLAALTLPGDHSRALNSRISALARAHELLDDKLSRQDGIDLAELVAAELEPYATETGDRLVCLGPSLRLPGRHAVALGLVLNELATNSLKYGALSSQTGELRVSWSMDGDRVGLTWHESGGPEVSPAAIENMGSRLLHRLVESQLRGTIQRRLGGYEVDCRIEFPLTPPRPAATT